MSDASSSIFSLPSARPFYLFFLRGTRPLLGTEDGNSSTVVATSQDVPVLVIALMQVVALWATMQSFFSYDTWWRVR